MKRGMTMDNPTMNQLLGHGKPFTRSKVVAFCPSRQCCGLRFGGRQGTPKPNAKPSDTDCPDCSQVLLWKTVKTRSRTVATERRQYS